MDDLPAGLVLRAVEALRDPETFTDPQRALVSILMHLSYESGREAGRHEYDAMLVAELCALLEGDSTPSQGARGLPPRQRAVGQHTKSAAAVDRRRRAGDPKILAEVRAERIREAARQRARAEHLIEQAEQSSSLWTDWRQVHGAVGPAAWNTVWQALAPATRRQLGDLKPDRIRPLHSATRRAA